jgi:hypothetical protein
MELSVGHPGNNLLIFSAVGMVPVGHLAPCNEGLSRLIRVFSTAPFPLFEQGFYYLNQIDKLLGVPRQSNPWDTLARLLLAHFIHRIDALWKTPLPICGC